MSISFFGFLASVDSEEEEEIRGMTSTDRECGYVTAKFLSNETKDAPSRKKLLKSFEGYQK